MHLETVEIKNFRSHQLLRVELQPGLNALVGRNNTGKTNLFAAIRQALGPAASRGESIWLERDDFYRASATADPEMTMTITLTFSGLSEGQRAHFYEIVDFDLGNINNSKAIIRFEASWPKGKKHASVRRTGGPIAVEPPEVSSKLLESIPVTFLPALRDAEAALAPGSRNRLAMLLRDVVARTLPNTKDEIVNIFATANQQLVDLPLVDSTAKSLNERTKQLTGTDHAKSAITAAELDFDRILRTLQMQMTDSPIGSLSANGLGFNNLLYVAVVLEHLKQESEDECPLLLVEEPEAHLHPQLTILLSEYLVKTTPGKATPQTLVTTHSPTMAARIPPRCIQVLYAHQTTRQSHCRSLAQAGMSEREERELQRMMDVTKATLYFAKGVILVEGISESLLIPVLASRLGYDLSKEHISVVPICGVAFETFAKLLSPRALGFPVAIISDADPKVKRGTDWTKDEAEASSGSFTLSDRTTKLLRIFSGHANVGVFHSKLTLEYDLAEAGEMNASVMAKAWESCFENMPGTFNTNRVLQAGASNAERALVAWRGICRANHSGGKADFAHRLAETLAERNAAGGWATNFEPPRYISKAIEYVVKSLHPQAPTSGPEIS